MDILELLSSVNKIGLFAFIVVFGVLVYEISLFRKEHSRKINPKIPNFNPLTKSADMTVPNLEKSNSHPEKKAINTNKILIILLALALPIIGWFTFSQNKSAAPAQVAPQVIISEMKSKGIRVFDKTWQELDAKQVPASSSPIYIAVESIPTADIDRARIRINSTYWKTGDITVMYNESKRVYYREYKISSGESKLNIEAQLHSREDGWLGD